MMGVKQRLKARKKSLRSWEAFFTVALRKQTDEEDETLNVLSAQRHSDDWRCDKDESNERRGCKSFRPLMKLKVIYRLA